MKNFKRLLGLTLVFSTILSQSAFAQMGDMGFFGGISEGTRLPKTTEILLEQEKNNKNANTTIADNLNYKEVVFLDGRPVTFEGLLTVKTGKIDDTVNVGTYKETYTVRPSDTTAEDISIERTITFNVNFRRENNQMIKDYEVSNWNETITTPGGDFRIDERQSRFGISVIEDHTPGVTYYKGNVSRRAVYTAGGEAEGATTLETSGSFYGYKSAWSSTETHRVDGTVYAPDWQMQYQVRPSVSVAKLIQYDKNEPTAISFEGNYKEVMENKSGLEYDIFVKPKQFYDVSATGRANIASYNSFEQLIAPDLSALKGHFAESDIKRLFAMQVLEGAPSYYQPNQAITRGQYVTALVKAMKMPIKPTTTATTTTNTRRRTTEPITIVFPDVPPERPEYPYIMAAYEAGLTVGRQNGNFAIDEPLDRQEAIVILLRSIGLEQLGLSPTPATVFTDDYKLASWAKKEVYAAWKIGLIRGDEDGAFNPTKLVSKADAAAFLNRLIDYMRADIALDYTEHIVHYAN